MRRFLFFSFLLFLIACDTSSNKEGKNTDTLNEEKSNFDKQEKKKLLLANTSWLNKQFLRISFYDNENALIYFADNEGLGLENYQKATYRISNDTIIIAVPKNQYMGSFDREIELWNVDTFYINSGFMKSIEPIGHWEDLVLGRLNEDIAYKYPPFQQRYQDSIRLYR